MAQKVISKIYFRYKVIVYSATNRTPPKMSTTILTLIAIWGLSALLSFPLIFAMDMKVVAIPHILMNMVGDSAIAYCAEEWGEYKRGRLVYSIFSLVVQVIIFEFMFSTHRLLSSLVGERYYCHAQLSIYRYQRRSPFVLGFNSFSIPLGF